LREVLGEVGWVDRVIVNQTTGKLIDGHARVTEAINNGETEIPVTYVVLSESEERLVLATLDPLSKMAETDIDSQLHLIDQIEADNAKLCQFLSDLTPLSDPAGTLKGMADLKGDEDGAFRSVLVNFATPEHVQEFAELVGHDTLDADSMWFEEDRP